VQRAEFGADIVVERREARGVVDAFERFEIEFGEIEAIPVEAVRERVDTTFDFSGAVAIGEVHELAPVEVGVLEEGGFFAPFGMIVPELFGDVREFDPGVDEDGAAMAGVDQFCEILVALRVGLVIVPGGDLESADAGGAPTVGHVIGIGAKA